MIACWIFWFALLCLVAPLAARAQSSPNWVYRYVPSAQEWNTLFASKVDTNGGTATNLTVNNGTLNSPTISGVSLLSGNLTVSGSLTVDSPGLASLGLIATHNLAQFGWVDVNANGVGTINWTTSSTDVGNTLFVASANEAGTMPATTFGTLLHISTPSFVADSSGELNGSYMAVIEENLGAGRKGGQSGLLVSLTETGAPADTGQFYGGISDWANVSYGNGSQNWVMGYNQIILNSGADVALAELHEDALVAASGSSVAYKSGDVVLLGGLDVVHGSKVDSAFATAATDGGGSWNTILSIGRPTSGFVGMNANTQIVQVFPSTVTTHWENAQDYDLADFRQVYQNGFLLAANGFYVGPQGMLRSGDLELNTISNPGATIDIDGQEATALAVASGGAGCQAGDILPDGEDGLIELNTVSGGVVQSGGASYARSPHDFSGSPPATVTPAYGGHCTTLPTFTPTWASLGQTITLGGNATVDVANMETINQNVSAVSLEIVSAYTTDENQGAQIRFVNTNASPRQKSIRLNQQGHLQIENSAYTDSIWDLDDSGNLILAGGATVMGAAKFESAISDTTTTTASETTGFSVTIPNNVNKYIVTPSGTLASGTITMPASPAQFQSVLIASTQTITALTLDANTGQTISNAITTIGPGAGATYIYDSSTWYRTN